MYLVDYTFVITFAVYFYLLKKEKYYKTNYYILFAAASHLGFTISQLLIFHFLLCSI
jgi:hypothetical protein